jgi:hypothetical protein
LRDALEIAVLALSAVALVLVGVTGLFSPAQLFDPLGVPLLTPAGRNEIRAAYGGMHLGVGLLLIVWTWQRERRRAALWLVAAFMGGLALGRLASLFADGAPGSFVLRLWVPEALAASIAAALLSLRRRGHGNGAS